MNDTIHTSTLPEDDDHGFDVAPAVAQQFLPTDPAAVAAAEMAKAEIQLAYYLATQKPRSEADAWRKILRACERPKFAEKAIYRKPVGNDEVVGPSVRLAEEIIRSWRNILIRTPTTFDDAEKRKVNVVVIDLEANNRYDLEIVVEKTVERKFAGKDRTILGERINSRGDTVYIVAATEDEFNNKLNAQISKAFRTLGLRHIPADIVEDAMAACFRTQADQDRKDPEHARKTVIYQFDRVGVTAKQLEVYIGCPMQQVNPDQLANLRAIYRAIEDKETTWQAVMDAKNADQKTFDERTAATAETIKQNLAAARGKPAAVRPVDPDPEPDPAPQDPSAATEPDDWDLLEGEDLKLDTGRLCGDSQALKARWAQLVKAGDWNDLRRWARDVVASRQASQ